MVICRAFKVEREDICDGEYCISFGEMSDQSEESVAHVSVGLAVDQSVVQLLQYVVFASRTEGRRVWEDSADSSCCREYSVQQFKKETCHLRIKSPLSHFQPDFIKRIVLPVWF